MITYYNPYMEKHLCHLCCDIALKLCAWHEPLLESKMASFEVWSRRCKLKFTLINLEKLWKIFEALLLFVITAFRGGDGEFFIVGLSGLRVKSSQQKEASRAVCPGVNNRLLGRWWQLSLRLVSVATIKRLKDSGSSQNDGSCRRSNKKRSVLPVYLE